MRISCRKKSLQTEPDAPQSSPGLSLHGLCPRTALVETHSFSDQRHCNENSPGTKSYYNRCLSCRLGSQARGEGSECNMEFANAVHSHKLLETIGCITGTETFSQRAACSGQNRQYHHGGIYQQGGLCSRHLLSLRALVLGILNRGADLFSKGSPCYNDWKLHLAWRK